MKSFKQFREGGFDNADEINVKVKKKKKAGSKTPKNKKSGNVEVMPNIPDGKKGMTTNVTNEEVLNEKSGSKSQQRFMGMVHAAKKGEKAASPEVAKAASSIKKKDAKEFASTKHKGLPEKKVKKESFEGGVNKARRDYRSGTLLTFKQFMSKLTDILDEWEK